MLDWLKSLLTAGPSSRPVLELEAKLLPINNQRLFGEAEFEIYRDQSWELEVEVDFRNGQSATPLSVYVEGQPMLNLSPDYDESEGKLCSRRGDDLPLLIEPGMQIEVRQEGIAVLAGTFGLSPRFRQA